MKIGMFMSWLENCPNDEIRDLLVKDITIHNSKEETRKNSHNKALKNILIIQVTEWSQSSGYWSSYDSVNVFFLYYDLMTKTKLWEPETAQLQMLVKHNVVTKLGINS
ncbi:MAG: hypothetical protein SCARUB_04798 [Candidatus Scalindua rubra]|uniref:Uncharacterized protein n=1 Tax=Candidatus Scalindua rubra TaxID=1872076 RepID=A0A1E3X393_9BACT|nr:MAG: hypothetical protein SCARUB_04798 [Candidatus Scalindua rubra]